METADTLSTMKMSPRLPKDTINKVITTSLWAACTATIVGALDRGYEGSWYPLGTYIHHTPDAAGPYIYRVLFPFLAASLERAFPGMNDLQSFKATQIPCIAITVYLIGKWGGLFLPQYGRFLGYMLAALMIAPTINYLNFYDIPLVGFWTACLLLLYFEKPKSYLLVFAIATLNHENILLLVPTTIAYLWGHISHRKCVLFGIAQIATWLCVRGIVANSFHVPRVLFDNELDLNLFFWRHYDKRGYLYSAVVLFPWWALAAMGWKYAPKILRCATLSFPALILVTILFGKLDEARQFNGFIPTCIGLICCLATSMTQQQPNLLDRKSEPANVETMGL